MFRKIKSKANPMYMIFHFFIPFQFIPVSDVVFHFSEPGIFFAK